MKTLFVLNDPPYGTERSYTDWTEWAENTLVF